MLHTVFHPAGFAQSELRDYFQGAAAALRLPLLHASTPHLRAAGASALLWATPQ